MSVHSLVDNDIKYWLEHINRNINNQKMKYCKQIVEVLTYIKGKPKDIHNKHLGIDLAINMCIDMEIYNLNSNAIVNKFCETFDSPDDNLSNIIYILTTIYEGTDSYAKHYIWEITDKIINIPPYSTHMVYIIEILEQKYKRQKYKQELGEQEHNVEITIDLFQ